MENYQPHFDTAELIAKYLRKELTVEEKIELDNWLGSNPGNPVLFNKICGEAQKDNPAKTVSPSEKSASWTIIEKKTVLKKSAGTTLIWKRLYPFAAILFIFFSAGIVINRYFLKKTRPENIAHQHKDVLPGGNKAILTLANGSKIALNNVGQGQIARQRNATIKIKNGRLIYQIDDTEPGQPDFIKVIAYNTLSTPRGGQYEAELPDGTKVWLNSASSLTYPVVFAEKERRVELTGEAYFEVAKNAACPFFVKTSNQTVQVLGTHFNINSYRDEQSVKTTLLEGSIKVTGNQGEQTVKIKAGEQAINIAGSINVIDDADTEEAVAWKNGKFMFRNTDLQTVMRQLSRWYDVDVEFQGAIAARHYHGRISRDVPVSQVFEILKTSGVNFIINGRTIIVKS